MATSEAWAFNKFRILMELRLDRAMRKVSDNMHLLSLNDFFKGKLKYKKISEYCLLYYLIKYSEDKATESSEIMRVILFPSPSDWKYSRYEEHYSNQQFNIYYRGEEYTVTYKINIKVAHPDVALSQNDFRKTDKCLEKVYGPEYKVFKRSADREYRRAI